MHLTVSQAKNLPLKPYYNKLLVRARPLQQADYKASNGVRVVKDKEIHFEVGDYLCNSKDEWWIVGKAAFEKLYRHVSDVDVEGFINYRQGTKVMAIQMQEPFSVTLTRGDDIQGKPNDYLLVSGDAIWILDSDNFSKTYAPM